MGPRWHVGKAGAVLDFLRGGHQDAVADDASGRVGVIGIHAEDSMNRMQCFRSANT